MVELGETVGIIAAQSIGEPGTQLTMRTFHTGGIFSGKIEKTILSPIEGNIYYNSFKNGKRINTKYKEKVFITTKKKKIIIYQNKLKRYKITVPKNTIIFAKPKQKIFLKQILAQIIKENKKNKKTKEIKEIKTTLTGFIYKEKKNSNTENFWILSSNILTFYQLVKNNILSKNKIKVKCKNNIVNKFIISKNTYKKLYITYKKDKKLVVYDYLIQNKVFDKKELLTKKENTEKVLKSKKELSKVGTFLIKEKLYTKNEKFLFCALIIQNRKKIFFIKKAKIYNFTEKKKEEEKKDYTLTIRKNNILFYINYKKQKTEDIIQGLPKVEELLEAKKKVFLKKIKNSLHEKLQKYFIKISKRKTNEIAAKKSIKKIQKALTKKIQEVYISQGVVISDKHLEIIIKQMTSKIIIKKEGDSKFISGEIIELIKVEKLNKKLKNKIIYEPIIIGISKLSLTNESFIAEACFQETTRILTKSAIEGKIDWLYGLKENLILGNLIPAGTNDNY